MIGIFSATPPLIKTTTTQLTPHRIELRAEVEEIQNGDDAVVPIVKAKKKLHVQTEQHKLTEYFPVRRSVRKTKKTVLEEKQRCLEHLLRHRIEEGLEVQMFEGKGRGVVAAKTFEKGDFVVEYSGDLIDLVEAKKREQIYAEDHKLGCYMYYFKYKGQQYCIDATEENGTLGRLVNHSRNGNLVTRTVCVDNTPRLVLIAKNHIKIGEELTYDYGDRSKESLQYHPWLAY